MTAAINKFDGLGLKDWGSLGGTCCNYSDSMEWGVGGGPKNGLGFYVPIPPGTCTYSFDNCDGMTCLGGFYKLDGLLNAMKCPTKDDVNCQKRWTPGKPFAPPPGEFVGGDNPPPTDYIWAM